MYQLDLKLSADHDPAHLTGEVRSRRGFSRGVVFLTLLTLCWSVLWLAAYVLFKLLGE